MKMMNLGLLAAASVAAIVGAGAPPKRVGVKLNTPTGQPPRRLSTDKTSPDYDPAMIRRVLVKFNGVYRNGDCHAYDASDSWIDVRIRRPKTGKFSIGDDGSFITERLYGKVEPEWKPAPQAVARPPTPAAPPLDLSVAAEEKRARKAAKRARDAAE